MALEVVVFVSMIAGTEFFLFTALGLRHGKEILVLTIFTVILQGASCPASSLNLKFYHFNFLGSYPLLQFQDDLYSQRNANSTWNFYFIFSLKISKCSLNKVVPPFLGREVVFLSCRWGKQSK